MKKLSKSKPLNLALAVGLVATNLVTVVPAYATDTAARSSVLHLSNSRINVTSATFDKHNPKDLTVRLTLNGNELNGITNGEDELAADTDYTVSEDGKTVTILKEYLAEQALGKTALKFNFSAGLSRTLSITVKDTTPSAKINLTKATFDKYKPKDVAVKLTLNGREFEGITNGEDELVEDTDYTASSSSNGKIVTITILKEYLAEQSKGIAPLKFNFDAGTSPVLSVTVKDTTPSSVIVAAAEKAVTALETAVKADLTVEANLIAAEKAVTAANAAVDKVSAGTTKDALQARVAAAAKTVADARTAFDAGKTEAEVEAAAETAVKAYEDAAVATPADVAAAEALGVTANTKVDLVKDADKKAGFQARIAAKKAIVDAAKAEFTDIENAAAAVTALETAAAADLTVEANLTAAEAAVTAANAALANVEAGAVKDALQAKIATAAEKVTKARAAFDAGKTEAEAEAAAETAVKAYEDAPLTTLAEVTAAEALGVTANTKVEPVKDTAKKAAFQARIDAKKKLVDAAKVSLALPVVSSVSSINATTLEVVLADKPAADPTADKFTVTVNGTAVAAPTAVTKLASDLTGKTYRLTIATLNGQQGSVTVNGTAAAVASGKVYAFDYKAPSVTSIAAKGPKTLEVTFDEQISSDTTALTGVIIPDNFTVWKAGTQVGATTNQKVVLDSTGTKVILTLDPAAALVPADYVLRVGEADQSPVVKDVAGNVLYGGTEVSFRPTAADLDVKVAPSLAKAEYNNGLGTLKLIFTKDTTVANLDVTKLSIGGVAITSDAVKTQTASNVITLTLSAANKAAVNAVTGVLTLTSAAGAYSDGTTATTGESILITKTSPAVILTAGYSQESKILTLTFDQAVKLGTIANIKVNSDAGTEATAAGATAVNADGTPVSDATVASATWNLKLAPAEAAKLESDTTTKLKVYMAAGAVTNNDSASTQNVATTYTDGGVAVTYTADTTNPFVQSVVFDDNANTLKIAFNENLDVNSAAIIANLKAAGALKIGTDATTNFVDLSGLTYGAAPAGTTFAIDGTDKKLFVIALGTTDAAATSGTFRSKLEAMNQSGKSIKVWLAKDAVIDNDNLKNVATTFDTGVVATFKDYTSPSLNAFNVLSSTKIQVSFSEKVDKTSAQTVANYVITDRTAAQLAVTNAELQADGVTVYLTTAAQESGRPYNLAVKGVKDLAGNIMNDSVTNSFTGNGTAVTAKEKVSSAVATIGNNSKDDVIKVVFNEIPNQSLALDKANYVILEHSSTDAAAVWTNATAVDISDAALTVDSSDLTAKTIKIALGNYNLKDNTTYKVVVSNVTDIYGNVLDTANASVVTAATTSTAPALVPGGIAVTNTAAGAVTMKFNEELKNADVASNYSVGGQAPTKATYTWDATASQATVVLDLATALTSPTPPNVILTTSGTPAVTNVTSLAGKGFVSATIPGPASYADKVAPAVDTVVATINPSVKDDTLVITFKDNDILPAAANIKADYVITDAQGTVIPADDYTVAFNDNVLVGGNTVDRVTITFDQGVVGSVDRTYNLQASGIYTVAINGILDTSGNVMGALTKTATLVNPYSTGVDVTANISGTVTKSQVGNVITVSGNAANTIGTVSLTATKANVAVDIKKTSINDFALRVYNSSGSQVALSDSTISLAKTLLFGQLAGGASNVLVANIAMNYGQLKTAMNNVAGTTVGGVQIDLFDLAGNKTTVTLNLN